MSFNPEKLNIKDLTIEEPEKQVVFFDQNKEITEDDWDAMKKSLIDFKKSEPALSNSWNNYFEQATKMKMLDPTVNLGLSQGDYRFIEYRLNYSRNEKSSPKASLEEELMHMKVLNPTMLQILPEDWEQMKEKLNRYRKYEAKPSTPRIKAIEENKFMLFAKQAVTMKILDPDIDLNLTEEDWNGMEKNLKRLHGKGKLRPMDTDLKGHRIENFCNLLARMKILNPQYKFELSEDDWDIIMKKFNFIRDTQDIPADWKDFCELAQSLKVITAKDVKITEQGLEIEMPEKETTESLAIPEKRNF